MFLIWGKKPRGVRGVSNDFYLKIVIILLRDGLRESLRGRRRAGMLRRK